MSDVHYLNLVDVSQKIRSKAISSEEVTRTLLARIEKLDKRYGSYRTVLTERAMSQARAADAEIARGIWRGPLHGVPIALKDLCYRSIQASRLHSMPRSSTGSSLPAL
jgi:amidase